MRSDIPANALTHADLFSDMIVLAQGHEIYKNVRGVLIEQLELTLLSPSRWRNARFVRRATTRHSRLQGEARAYDCEHRRPDNVRAV